MIEGRGGPAVLGMALTAVAGDLTMDLVNGRAMAAMALFAIATL